MRATNRFRSASPCPGRFAVPGFLVLLAIVAGDLAAQIPTRPAAPVPVRPISPPAEIAGLTERPYAPLAFSRAWLAKMAKVRTRRSELKAEGRLDGMDPATAAAEGAALTGTLRVPVIAIRYSDVAAPFPNTVLAARLFGPTRGDTVSYSSYWREVSNGLLEVTGVVTPWLTLPHSARHYLPAEQYGWARYGRIAEVIEHALALADKYLDFGQFDNDGPDGEPNSGDDDGFADFVAIVYALPCGARDRDGEIWPHRAAMPPTETRSPAANGGVIRIADYVILRAIDPVTCSPMHVGVLAHETGHALGLPDLYAYDGLWPGIGDWGLMGTGSHGEEYSPAHPSAWEKEQLGWVRVDWIDGDTETLTLPPVEREPVVYRYDVPDTGRYLLLENRQRLGSDSHLPGEGLLLWRIEPERGELGAWNNDERRPAVGLIEAGERGEFGNVLRGHPMDPFPGESERTEYHSLSEPRFRLSSIVENNDVITARLGIDRGRSSLLPRQRAVRLTALAGGIPARHTVGIAWQGGASFSFHVVSDEPWLEATSSDGAVVLRAFPGELPPGSYADTVRLVDGAGATAATILVSFYVATPGIGQIVATELPWSWGLAARNGRILQASFGWDPLGLRPRPRVLELWEGSTHPSTLVRIPSDALYSPAIDAAGNAWVLARADDVNHLYRLRLDGRAEVVASRFGGSGPAYGVAALPDGGVLVSEWDGQIHRVDPDGSVALKYTVNARLYQIAADSAGTIFAALFSGDILRIAPNGLTTVIPTGYGAGRLVAIAATPDGSVFAAERGGRGRIERIDAQGHREVVFQRRGAHFYGVTVDGAFIYALDLSARQLLRIPLPEAGVLAAKPPQP